ncbi:hypothetical protein P7K49_012582 [Saguinus oedipus]|uniref:Uncharacterized protein n=1 Tax=Saguinus oedipus TaxID=9490 RepID=A0ABQ9VDG1_SAGOE|nr:hypothetical protein P7K49_012582 [Saguinus oedipus]
MPTCPLSTDLALVKGLQATPPGPSEANSRTAAARNVWTPGQAPHRLGGETPMQGMGGLPCQKTPTIAPREQRFAPCESARRGRAAFRTPTPPDTNPQARTGRLVPFAMNIRPFACRESFTAQENVTLHRSDKRPLSGSESNSDPRCQCAHFQPTLLW